MLLLCKYDFIYLFSNLFSLISLNGPFGRKKVQEGKIPKGNSVGAWRGCPKWAKGPPGGPAHLPSRTRLCGDSPTLPGWQGRLPLGAYIRRGTPSLLIHQLIPDFSLDLVVPKLEPLRAEQGDLLHYSPLPRCWCSGPNLPLLVLDWSFGGRRLHRTCATPFEVLR